MVVALHVGAVVCAGLEAAGQREVYRTGWSAGADSQTRAMNSSSQQFASMVSATNRIDGSGYNAATEETTQPSTTQAWTARASSHDTPIVLTLASISLDRGPLRYFGGFDFTPDGRTLMVGHFFGMDRALTAWDTTSWAKRWSTPTGDTPVDVAVSRDGPWVATVYGAPHGAPVWLWDANTGAALGTIGESNPLWGPLAALPDERLVLGERPTNGPASLSVWDARNGTRVRQCCVSPGGVWAMAVDRVGERVATYAEGRLSMWDLPSGNRVHDFGGVQGAWPSNCASVAPALAFHPEGDRVIVGGLVSEAGPMVVEASTGHKVVNLPGVKAESLAGAVTVSPCGRWLVGAYGWQEDDHWPWRDVCIRVWDLAAAKLVQRVKTGSPCHRLAFSPDGSLLVSGSTERLQVWRVGIAGTANEGHG